MAISAKYNKTVRNDTAKKSNVTKKKSTLKLI